MKNTHYLLYYFIITIAGIQLLTSTSHVWLDCDDIYDGCYIWPWWPRSPVVLFNWCGFNVCSVLYNKCPGGGHTSCLSLSWNSRSNLALCITNKGRVMLGAWNKTHIEGYSTPRWDVQRIITHQCFLSIQQLTAMTLWRLGLFLRFIPSRAQIVFDVVHPSQKRCSDDPPLPSISNNLLMHIQTIQRSEWWRAAAAPSANTCLAPAPWPEKDCRLLLPSM